jgi:hypothetical protein
VDFDPPHTVASIKAKVSFHFNAGGVLPFLFSDGKGWLVQTPAALARPPVKAVSAAADWQAGLGRPITIILQQFAGSSEGNIQ